MLIPFKQHVCTKALFGGLALVAALVTATAHAGSTLVGGGAGLPVIGYTGQEWPREVMPVAGSLMGEYSAEPGNPVIAYCQAGSGAGKNVFVGASGTGVQNVCANVPAPPTGFSAAAVGRSDLTRPNFATTESPLTPTDYANYLATRSPGFPVEIPVLAGSIAIVFNKAGVDFLDLSTQQVCGVFSGQIFDWSQLTPSVSGPIRVAYRSDASGTNFALSNFLSAACSGTPSKHFVTSPNVSTVVNAYFSSIPSNWTGLTLDHYIDDFVASNDGTIGYMGAANFAGAFVNIATVNGLDPIFDFGNAPWTIGSSDIKYNYLVSGVDATTGRPLISLASGAPATQCIALVSPDAYANPPSSYPIVAISYLLANSANNGTDLNAMRNLMWAPFNTTIISRVGSIGPGTGASFVNAGFTQSQLSGCIN